MFLGFNKNKFNEEYKDIIEKRRKERQEREEFVKSMSKIYKAKANDLIKRFKKSRG